MIEALIALFLITLVLLIIAWRRNDGSAKKAAKIGLMTLKGVLPLLFFAFILAGFLQVAVPPELIKNWLGDEAGLRGIIIGTVGGALIPAGPYLAFPIISAVHKAGAGIGTVIAFITGWSMMGIANIFFELAIMGSRFMVRRVLLFIAFPILAGWLAYVIL